jgi:uncharacterized membrane protein YgcG
MPEERDIEKTLRAWAKRRREDAGAPLELHPATRKLLQDEISRLKSGPRREPGLFVRLLWSSPLRLALNLFAIAVLIFAAAVFLPRLRNASSNLSANPALLAENKRLPDQNGRPLSVESDNPGNAQPVPAVETATTIAAPPPVPAIAARKAEDLTANSVALADNGTTYKTPVASAAPSVAPPAPTAVPLALDEEKLATPQPGAAELPVAPANQPAYVAVVVQKLSWINSPVSADRRDGAADKLGAAPMLASFRTEQAGDELRVIDADGSVYVGNLTAATEILDSNGAFRAAQTRAFRVTGTNLTRREPVVFTGNLIFADQSSMHGKKDISGTVVVNGGIGGGGGGFGGGGFARPETNAPVTKTTAGAIPGSAARTAVVGGALPAQPQFRVEGSAFIGTNEIRINAVPVAP